MVMRARRKRETSAKPIKQLGLSATTLNFENVDFLHSRPRSTNTPEVKSAHSRLISWLNGEGADSRNPAFKNTPESTLRILKLLELVKQATNSIENEAKLRMPYIHGISSEQETRKRLRNTSAKTIFYGAFNEYATVPYLVFNGRNKHWGIGRWPLGLPGAPGSDITEEELDKLAGFAHAERARPTQQSWRPYGEVTAAYGILYLVASGVLDRVRQCHCGQWFFAPRNDSVAHNATCRKSLFDKTPNAIEMRKKRARNNALIRSGKIYLHKQAR